MGNAISACMSKYATFSGRASRSEYWYFYLFYVIVYVVGLFVSLSLGNSNIVYIFAIPFWLPLFAASIRRMHDVGKSGWFILIPIYNLILACTPGTPGPNSYGSN